MTRLIARLTLLALILTACTPTSPTPTTVTVIDAVSGQRFTYQPGGVVPSRAALPGTPYTETETNLLAAINASRARSGSCPTTGGAFAPYTPVPALTPEGHLHRAAVQYAQVLAAQGSFTLSHTGADGTLPAARMIAAGYTPTVTSGHTLTLRENLGAALPYDPQVLVDAWERSADHCATLHALDAQDVGVGVVVSERGATYVALDLAGQPETP